MKTLSRSKWVVAAICAIGFLQACSTSRSSPASTPVTPVPASTATTETQKSSWSPQLAPGKWQYFIHDSSSISINNDTTARVEPIESTTIYSLSIADSSNTLLLSGHIDSQVVNSRLARRAGIDTTLATDLHASVSKQARLISVANNVTIGCNSSNSSPTIRIAELLTVLPLHPVKVGDKWSDTASTTTCHGKIPLTQKAVREYELLDFSSCERGAAKVRRIVSDTFAGSSPESTNHLSASGSGTATSTLCLERTTGALLSSDGQSNLELTITTIRGVFPFTQNTTTHIELR